MSDQVFLQFLVYAIVVGGAWYHGWKQGIDTGAGRMYDYLFEKAVKRGKYKIAKFKIEDEQAPKL